MNIGACLSSNSIEWATPSKLFEELDDEFHFTLDPCCTHQNAKCKKHFTKVEDGLSQNWGVKRYFAIHHMEEKKLVFGLKSAMRKV